MSVSTNTYWNRKQIDRTKAEIKAELDAQAGSGPKARLKYIFQAIRDLDNEVSSDSTLKRFLLIVSALLHHRRHGGLNDLQLRRMVSLAHRLLQMQGIKRRNSSLDFLYGELHLAMALIYRHKGLHWNAVWEQQTSFFLAHRSPLQGMNFERLSTAIQAVRLGFTDLALEEFQAVYEREPTSELGWRAGMEVIKIHRLTHHFSGMTESVRRLEQGHLSDEFRLELEWEKNCRVAIQTNSIEPLILSVLKGKKHHDPSYVIEAYLWSRAVQTRNWLTRFPRIEKLAPGMKLKGTNLGIGPKAIAVLDLCYDAAIPQALKLKQLGEVLAQAGEFRTLDRELLMWAAATRWLVRARAEVFAKFTLLKYQSLCLTLSNGTSNDVLGVLSDINGHREEAEPQKEAG